LIHQRLLEERFKDQNLHIKITFFLPKINLESGEDYRMVLRCAQQYADLFPTQIEIAYIDSIAQPDKLTKYQQTFHELGYSLYSTSVLIECDLDGDQTADRFTTFYMSACFRMNEETQKAYAFQGETKFTSGILTVTAEDRPVVTFTQGHGEPAKNQMALLDEMFVNAGFVSQYTNTRTEKIDENTRILVIYAPKSDFSGYMGEGNEDETEINRISHFLSRNFSGEKKDSAVMVFMDASTPRLPELDALLAKWGLSVQRTTVYDHSKSLTYGPNYVVANYIDPYYASNDDKEAGKPPVNQIAYTLVESLASGESATPVVFINGAPVIVTERSIAHANSEWHVEPILTTYPSAQITVDQEGGESETVTGTYNLAAISSKTDIVNNEYYDYHLMVFGTTHYSETKLIVDNAFANAPFLYKSMKILGSLKLVAVDIQIKQFDDNAFHNAEDMTTDVWKSWLIRLTCALPGAVCILGIAIWVKRRYL
jgi:hypothetical protein